MACKLPKRSGSLSTQLMMFLIFVVFPASWTAIAPVSRISLERDQAAVSATARVCMYFVVPYYTARIADVSKVRVDHYLGQKDSYNAHLSEAQNRPDRRGKTSDNAELVLSNIAGDELRVPIDLDISESMQSQIEVFLAESESDHLALSAAANRTLYFLSFPILLLTLVYVLLQALALVRLLLGNPYWPFDAELASQLKEITRAHRNSATKASR